MIFSEISDSSLLPAWAQKDSKPTLLGEDDPILDFDPLTYLFGTAPQVVSAELFPMLEQDGNDLEYMTAIQARDASPEKQFGLNILDDFLHANNKNVFWNINDPRLDEVVKPVFLNLPESNLDNKENKPSQLSPDSGIEQDCINSSYDECPTNLFELIEQDKDDGLGETMKLNNDAELNKYLNDILSYKNNDTDDEEITDQDLINLAKITDSKWNEYLNPNVCDSVIDQDTKDFLDKLKLKEPLPSSNGITSNLAPKDEFSSLCAGLVLLPAPTEYNKLNIKEEVFDSNLFVLRNNSTTIKVEHNYSRKICVIESDEDEYEPVNKKRKRDEVDEDFSPYQKPKRKVGRPRTNFSKVNTQKTQPLKTQKTRAPKRTTQAAKKLKSISTVPFERRQQHNQAERERRDMLKKNLDIVEDMTPDHFLHLTQIALQSEKISKIDEFENNENNFTVDVLKKLDELVKKEPVNHRPKFKKASRNSKMVVLLGATYFISGLEKELKVKENRLAQLKKQYEDCLKRFNPTKASTKRVRRNY